MKIYVKSLAACVMRRGKVQQYLKSLRAKHDIVDTTEKAELALVWGCGFREDIRAHNEAYIRSLSLPVVVAGCFPAISPMEGFTMLPWANDEHLFPELFQTPLLPLELYSELQLCQDAAAYRKKNPNLDATFHDQFHKIVISEGCSHTCTYCSERLAFPEFRAFAREELVATARDLVSNGVFDIMLMADSLGQYPDLVGLLDDICAIETRVRIALNNLHPKKFLAMWPQLQHRLDRIAHLNMPIQSGSSRILSAMNRDYTRADLETIACSLQALSFRNYDTHVLLGFPGETNEDVDDTLSMITFWQPRYVMASAVMVTATTPTAAMPGQISLEQKRQRLERVKMHCDSIGILCNTDESAIMTDRLRRIDGRAKI